MGGCILSWPNVGVKRRGVNTYLIVDVLEKKCPTVETARYVIDQMTDEELNRDYTQERHGAMNLLQYCREKESVALAIVNSLPRFTRMLDPHPERHQSCLSDACRLGQKRSVEAIFNNPNTPEDLITCPNEHRATYLHQVGGVFSHSLGHERGLVWTSSSTLPTDEACYNGHPFFGFSPLPGLLQRTPQSLNHGASSEACCTVSFAVPAFSVYPYPKYFRQQG